MTTVTESLARRVIESVDAGLVHGLEEPLPGRLSVEIAVCDALGLPHGDTSLCITPAIYRLIHWLHDARLVCWSSPRARARGLRRLVVAALGSRGVLDDAGFVRRVARLAIQFCVPTALRAAAECRRASAQRARLLQAAEACERDPTREHAQEANAIRVPYTYGWADDEATDAATYAAFATSWAVSAAREADACAAYVDAAGSYDAYAARYARDAVSYAADAAICAADAAYAAAEAVHGESNDAKARAAYDEVLAEFAERVVSVLIDLRSPGAAYLTDCDGRHDVGLDVTA